MALGALEPPTAALALEAVAAAVAVALQALGLCACQWGPPLEGLSLAVGGLEGAGSLEVEEVVSVSQRVCAHSNAPPFFGF